MKLVFFLEKVKTILIVTVPVNALSRIRFLKMPTNINKNLTDLIVLQ